MRNHAESSSPLEACGLLAGKDGFVREVFLITNQAQSPVRFRMDPIEQLHAFDQMEAAGLELLGIFHSHPSGPETPSPTDIAEAAYQVVQIIWSPLGNQSAKLVFNPNAAGRRAAFGSKTDKYVEVTLQITPSE